jgi:hypothetical protein
MLIPLILDRLEYTLILKLSVSMFDNLCNFLTIVLNVILSQIHDSEGNRIFQMWSLYQIENLDPMSCLERVTSEIFQEFNDK